MSSVHQDCLKFILELKDHYSSESVDNRSQAPLKIAISGPQGSGKSTVAASLAKDLRNQGLNVVIMSLDDFYITHSQQLKKAASGNTLLQHRGLPGTHDLQLLNETLTKLTDQEPAAIVQFDKSQFSGEGDRVKESEFINVKPHYDIILLEGWCVGFRHLNEEELQTVWSDESTKTIKRHKFEFIQEINEELAHYDPIWTSFDGFIHLDAHNINYVYQWRLQQEHAMIASKGSGMTDEQVGQFVDGYMPAYELYLEKLRKSYWGPTLRLQLGSDRQVVVCDKFKF